MCSVHPAAPETSVYFRRDDLPATFFRWVCQSAEPKGNEMTRTTMMLSLLISVTLCAGGGSFEVGSEVEGYYSFQREWLNRKGASDHMVLMDIFGNSMEPELKAGDTVLIDESQKDILAGAFFAVGVDDTIMVKRLEKHPNKLVLISANKDYAPIYLKGEEINTVRIIGKVIWVCRSLK